MIRFKLHFDYEVNSALYEDYCWFIFRSVKRDIEKYMNLRKYLVREPYVLKSSLIKWRGDPPAHIDLAYYIRNCLEMKKHKGEYVIQLNESLRLPNSFTKVSTLVRMLEYGTDKMPAYPLIRTIMFYHSRTYQFRILEFMKERLFR